MTNSYTGHAMTGRDPATLDNLIDRYGDDVWLGPDGNADRGDRYSSKPAKPRNQRKDT